MWYNWCLHGGHGRIGIVVGVAEKVLWLVWHNVYGMKKTSPNSNN